MPHGRREFAEPLERAGQKVKDAGDRIGDAARQSKDQVQQGARHVRDTASNTARSAQNSAERTAGRAKQQATYYKEVATDEAHRRKSQAQGQYRRRKGQVHDEYQHRKQQAKDEYERRDLQARKEIDRRTAPGRFDETISGKGGTVEGFDEAEDLVTRGGQADSYMRTQQLKEMLFYEDKHGNFHVRKGNLALFNRVTFVLSGGHMPQDWGAESDVGVPMRDALSQAFRHLNSNTARYLRNMLDNDGVPSPAMRLLDLLGTVSVKQEGDFRKAKKSAKYIISDLTPAEARSAKRQLARAHGYGDTSLAGYIDKQLEKQGEKHSRRRIVREKAREKLPANKRRDEKDWIDPTEEEIFDYLVKSWDRKLAKAVESAQAKVEISLANARSQRKPKALRGKKRRVILAAKVQGTLGKLIADENELKKVDDVREALGNPTKRTKFDRALGGVKWVDDQFHERLVAAVIDTSHPDLVLDDDLPFGLDEKDEDDPARARMDARADRLKAGKKMAELSMASAMLGDGGAGAAVTKRKELAPLIGAMSSDARQMLVAKYLPESIVQTYLNPSTPARRQQALFEVAWAGGLRDSIEAALFEAKTIAKNEKKVAKAEAKGDDEAAERQHIERDVVKIGSYLRFPGDPGPNYLALVDLSSDKIGTKVSTRTYGTRIWEICRKAKGAELYQIRSDVGLLLRLRHLVERDLSPPSKKNWDRFVGLYDLPPRLKLKHKGKDAPSATIAEVRSELSAGDRTRTDAAGEEIEAVGADTTMGEAYDAIQNKLEFDPAYWATLVSQEASGRDPSHGDTYSVITRAQIAAKRFTLDEYERRTDAESAVIGEADFMKRIWEQIPGDVQANIIKKIPNAHRALEHGAHLDVETRLERASGMTFRGKQTSWRTKKSSVVAAFEDLSGEELVHQWSNFDDLRPYHDRRKILRNQLSQYDKDDDADTDEQAKEQREQKVAELRNGIAAQEDVMAKYWPSINRERLAYLEENLSGGTRTEVLEMISNKLSAAMKADPEFVEAAKAAGLTADDYDAERIMYGHTMNKRRQLDTGLQYGAKNRLAVIKELVQARRDPRRVGQFIRDGGNGSINKSASQARKSQANLYTAHVRNTEKQLAEVRRDQNLTAEQRAEKVKEIRKAGAKQIEETREELDRRNKVFTKGRKAMVSALKKITAAILLAAVSVATFGQGTAAVVVAMILSGIAKGAAGALTKWAFEGDAFEQKELAKAVAKGAVKGALKALTAELITVMDAASGAVDFSTQAMEDYAAQSNYGELVKHAAITAAMRSAVADIPTKSMEYFLDAERPFRDFGANLDALIANNVAAISGRQLAAIISALSLQAGNDAMPFKGSGTQPSGNVLNNANEDFKATTNAAVSRLVASPAYGGKVVKKGLKRGAKAVYGTYRQGWKEMENEIVHAAAERKDDEYTDKDLPEPKELARLTDLYHELASDPPTKELSDLSDDDRKELGKIILYYRRLGVPIP